jgi:hypothetical protein
MVLGEEGEPALPEEEELGVAGGEAAGEDPALTEVPPPVVPPVPEEADPEAGAPEVSELPEEEPEDEGACEEEEPDAGGEAGGVALPEVDSAGGGAEAEPLEVDEPASGEVDEGDLLGGAGGATTVSV